MCEIVASLISTHIQDLTTSYRNFQQIKEGFKKNKFDEALIFSQKFVY